MLEATKANRSQGEVFGGVLDGFSDSPPGLGPYGLGKGMLAKIKNSIYSTPKRNLTLFCKTLSAFCCGGLKA